LIIKQLSLYNIQNNCNKLIEQKGENMGLDIQKTMIATMGEVLDMLPEGDIKKTIKQSVQNKADKFSSLEKAFEKMCSKKYSDETMSLFLNGWKATHLKMLPIYGLSCRLNQLGMASEDKEQKLAFLESSAYNAKTSHEDLGMGFDAISHGQLYDEFAFSMVKSDEWKLAKYDTKEANDFASWVYKSMLLESIPYALCINMFSEFYNHAEYAYSFLTFKYSMENFYGIKGQELEDAIRYIDVHNQYETEIHHFMAVINAIEKYEKASKEKVSTEIMSEVISIYIDKVCEAIETIAKKFD
jgi:hypothetical protein